MKELNLFLALLMLSFINLNAQNDEQLDYKNNIKFNPLSAALFGNYEFQYERAISDNSTVSLALGLKLSGGVIKLNGFDSSTIKTDEFEFTGFSITPEYRWYFQKNATKRTGLYLGGYYKFKSVVDNINGTYTSSNTNTSAPIEADVDITAHTFGALLGYKVMVGKHLYVDITIAGPGYSSTKLEITEKQPLPAEFYVDLGTEIADNFDIISGFVDNIEIKETSSNSGGDSFGLPAFRYGFKIGYSF
ncbi:DUF3575 domain-containing protein [Winogradskyella sp. 3972H.M.0a.05]|uniref:DUF3575 domain-containing protein n=1 Tax=Winogradskyella sp. 3972H.M.0a.05 TaxID=2950277 RepID=UPI003390A3C6